MPETLKPTLKDPQFFSSSLLFLFSILPSVEKDDRYLIPLLRRSCKTRKNGCLLEGSPSSLSIHPSIHVEIPPQRRPEPAPNTSVPPDALFPAPNHSHSFPRIARPMACRIPTSSPTVPLPTSQPRGEQRNIIRIGATGIHPPDRAPSVLSAARRGGGGAIHGRK